MGKDKVVFQMKCKTDAYGAGVCELKVKEGDKSAECLVKVDECGEAEVVCSGDGDLVSKFSKLKGV